MAGTGKRQKKVKAEDDKEYFHHWYIKRKEQPGYLDYHREIQSRYYKKHGSSDEMRLTQRGNRLQQRYWPGLTIAQALDEYDRLFKMQDGKCAICRKPQSAFKRRLHVDHNHSTKQVRGLLCYYCNRHLVGKNTLDSVTRLIKYLEVERGYLGKA